MRVGSRGDAAVQQLRDVDARHGCGDEAKVRKHGVTAADVAGVGEDVAEVVLSREGFERRGGIGDGDEVLAGAAGLRLRDERVEVREEREGLDGRAGLRRDEEERARRVDVFADGEDRRRVGRVEDVKLRPPVADVIGDALAQDFGRERAAAHAEQHSVGEATGPHLRGERVDLAGAIAYPGRDIEPAEAVGDGALTIGIAAPERRVAPPDAIRSVPGHERRDALIDTRLVRAERDPHATRAFALI